MHIKKVVGKQETCFTRLSKLKQLFPLRPECRQLTFSHFPCGTRRHPPLGQTMGGRSQHMPAGEDMQLKLLQHGFLRAQVYSLTLGPSLRITCSSSSASYKLPNTDSWGKAHLSRGIYTQRAEIFFDPGDSSNNQWRLFQ